MSRISGSAAELVGEARRRGGLARRDEERARA
jgi:hypothetical protein